MNTNFLVQVKEKTNKTLHSRVAQTKRRIGFALSRKPANVKAVKGTLLECKSCGQQWHAQDHVGCPDKRFTACPKGCEVLKA